MHAVWSGYISFGLVNIPVRAVPARQDLEVHLEGLHAECHSPIRQRKLCPCCRVEAAREELVRGFPLAGGGHVLIAPEEIESLGTPAKKTLYLLDFVEMAEVDPVWFEKPYFLNPGSGGERPYALLVRALSEAGRVGIGKVALRDREHLALIRPLEHGLVMHIIGFPDEVRKLEDAVPPREVEVDPDALELMRLLVEAMTRPISEGDYRDRYREALLELVDRKVGEEEIHATPVGVRAGVGELMDMLRRSLAEAR